MGLEEGQVQDPQPCSFSRVTREPALQRVDSVCSPVWPGAWCCSHHASQKWPWGRNLILCPQAESGSVFPWCGIIIYNEALTER